MAVTRDSRPGRVPSGHRGAASAAERKTPSGVGLPTVEAAVYALVLLGGLALRLGALDLVPLAPSEAANAWSSWSLFRWGTGETTSGPLYAYSSALLIALFGANDVVPRLMPALAGTAMLPLPLLLRRKLGREASLLATLFLAFSPSLVFFSRQASASILPATLSFAVLVFLVAFADSGRPQYLLAASASTGLLLTSGPLADFALASCLIVALAWLLWSFWRRQNLGATVLKTVARVGRDEASTYALVVAGVAILVATGAVSDVSGLQRGLVDPLQSGAVSFFTPAGLPWHFYLQMLAVYEPGLVACGVLGLGFLRMEKGGPRAWFAVWALVTLGLGAITGNKEPGLVAQMIVPLALLASFPTAAAWRYVLVKGREATLLAFGVTTVPLLVLLYIVILALPDPEVPGLALIAPLLALALVLAAWSSQVGPRPAAAMAGALAFCVFTLYAFSASVNVSFPGQDRVVPLLASASPSYDVRNLGLQADNLANLLVLRGAEPTVDLDANLAPSLAWYLRRQPDLRIGPAEAALAILPAEATAPPGYVGQRYRIFYVWEPASLDWRALARWMLLHEAPPAARAQDVMLYAKTQRQLAASR